MIADGPNEDEKTEKKEEFWNELTNIVENLVGRTIILGELSGRVGSNNNRIIEVMGRFGEEQKNMNGKRIINFCVDNNLSCTHEKYVVETKNQSQPIF